MRALLLVVVLCASAHAERDIFQVGAFGGVGPTEPVHTHYFFGGWMGVGLGDSARLELSGSLRDGLESETDLGNFLRTEALLDPGDPIADRPLWTVEGLVRVVPLRGRWAVVQSTIDSFALHFGFGGGVRKLVSFADEEHLAPTGILATGLDLRFVDWLRVRIDARGYGLMRRDDTLGLGAEILVGVGAGL
jgi:hypothetical protein